MHFFRQLKSCLTSPLRRRAPRWLRDNRGAAAVEFAIIALPFLLLVLGIIGISLYFFTSNALEHGVEAAARQIRTGQAQKNELTVGDFRKLVCDEAGTYIDCGKVRVLIQHASNWSGVSPAPCLDSQGNLVSSTGSAEDDVVDYSGEASEVVLVTLCYPWDLAEMFSFLRLGSGANGSGPAIVQAATAFRTEPYS